MSQIKELIQKIEANQKKKEPVPAVKKPIRPKTFEKKEEKNSEKKNSKLGHKTQEKKAPQKKKEEKEEKKKRFFSVKICTSQKSCGEQYGNFVWERICNDHDQDPNCESFEVQGFTFEKSQCQGACKKASNIRIQEENSPRHTQFSYITPLKASKLIKNIKSGASPENIKKL